MISSPNDSARVAAGLHSWAETRLGIWLGYGILRWSIFSLEGEDFANPTVPELAPLVLGVAEPQAKAEKKRVGGP